MGYVTRLEVPGPYANDGEQHSSLLKKGWSLARPQSRSCSRKTTTMRMTRTPIINSRAPTPPRPPPPRLVPPLRLPPLRLKNLSKRPRTSSSPPSSSRPSYRTHCSPLDTKKTGAPQDPVPPCNSSTQWLAGRGGPLHAPHRSTDHYVSSQRDTHRR